MQEIILKGSKEITEGKRETKFQKIECFIYDLRFDPKRFQLQP